MPNTVLAIGHGSKAIKIPYTIPVSGKYVNRSTAINFLARKSSSSVCFPSSGTTQPIQYRLGFSRLNVAKIP